jgi:hypothetical protein
MQPIDPTYPLFPTMCILCSALLLCIMMNRTYFQAWNLGLMILCICLFLENLTGGINAVIWADNADIKAYVYCDIGKPVQIWLHYVI